MQENPGCVVAKYSFPSLYAKAWYKAIHQGNLVGRFVKAGVCPFNLEAIKIPSIPQSWPVDPWTVPPRLWISKIIPPVYIHP